MFTLLILLAFAYIQDGIGQKYPPLYWAIAYGVLTLIFGLSVPFIANIIVSAIVTLYVWGYFVLIRRVSDHVFLWLFVMLAGSVFPALLPALVA